MFIPVLSSVYASTMALLPALEATGGWLCGIWKQINWSRSYAIMRTACFVFDLIANVWCLVLKVTRTIFYMLCHSAKYSYRPYGANIFFPRPYARVCARRSSCSGERSIFVREADRLWIWRQVNQALGRRNRQITAYFREPP